MLVAQEQCGCIIAALDEMHASVQDIRRWKHRYGGTRHLRIYTCQAVTVQYCPHTQELADARAVLRANAREIDRRT